jgi:hypothetical protein
MIAALAATTRRRWALRAPRRLWLAVVPQATSVTIDEQIAKSAASARAEQVRVDTKRQFRYFEWSAIQREVPSGLTRRGEARPPQDCLRNM